MQTRPSNCLTRRRAWEALLCLIANGAKRGCRRPLKLPPRRSRPDNSCFLTEGSAGARSLPRGPAAFEADKSRDAVALIAERPRVSSAWLTTSVSKTSGRSNPGSGMLLLSDRGPPPRPTSRHVTLPLYSPSLCTTNRATRQQDRAAFPILSLKLKNFISRRAPLFRRRCDSVTWHHRRGRSEAPGNHGNFVSTKSFQGREKLSAAIMECWGERGEGGGLWCWANLACLVWKRGGEKREGELELSQSESAHGWLGAKKLNERAGIPKRPIDSPYPVQALPSRRRLCAQRVYLIRLTEGFQNWISVLIS